jgi:hypothetical protein
MLPLPLLLAAGGQFSVSGQFQQQAAAAASSSAGERRQLLSFSDVSGICTYLSLFVRR